MGDTSIHTDPSFQHMWSYIKSFY